MLSEWGCFQDISFWQNMDENTLILLLKLPHFFFSSVPSLCSRWELSTVLKHQHSRLTVRKHSLTFLPIPLFQLPREDEIPIMIAMYFVNNITIFPMKHNHHCDIQCPSSGDAGLGTEQQSKGDLNGWLVSHCIIHPISQAYNRTRWRWQVGIPCSRAAELLYRRSELQHDWNSLIVPDYQKQSTGGLEYKTTSNSDKTQTLAVHHHQGFISHCFTAASGT